MTAIAWLIAIPLCLFALRRYVLLLASLAPRRRTAARIDYRVSLLMTARNAEGCLPQSLAALGRLAYPRHLIEFVIVSDGSNDATAAIAQRWAACDDRAQAIVLTHSRGKAAALQCALECSAPSDIVVVLDADAIPDPEALANLLGAFGDGRVGAACGYPDPGIDQQTIVARYAAVERWVAHLVTLAGKDRLALQPSVIGVFFGVRRSALIEARGFSSTSLTEDIDLSQRLTAGGWKTRWVGDARVAERVPDNFASFIAQRNRWTRGLLASGRSIRSVEDAFVAAGYLDRIFVVAAVMATVAGVLPWVVLPIYAGGPVVMIAIALFRSQAPRKWAFCLAVVAMAAVDVYISIRSLMGHARNSTVEWTDRRAL